MKMTGSWHIYRPGEPWQKSARAARVVITTDDFVAVCFAAPVVEMIPKGFESRHPALSRLGPDILHAGFDPVLARTRLRQSDAVNIADALLTQSALAGIGNVYKSEVLFLCRVDPFVPVSALSDDVLDAAIAKARDLMSRNLEGHPRATTGPRAFFPRSAPRYFVYGRAGEPCPACQTPIIATRTGTRRVRPPGDLPASGGEASRVTFFCPQCQPEGATGQIPMPPS